MNMMMERMLQMARVVEAALPHNLAKGDMVKYNANVVGIYTDVALAAISACRTEESDLHTVLKQNEFWRSELGLLSSLDIGLGVILADILSQSGYLFNHPPHVKEMEYIEVCRTSSDLLNPLSAISYNLFLGDPPSKDLPTKFDKRLAKDVEAILALLENPEKGIAAAEKMWDRRKNANMHRWYGTGPAHDYLLDPLILCILKYHKADFESDSIHMKGYRFLAANGF